MAQSQSPNTEKIRTILCPEFWDGTGKSAIIVRALYCLKYAGASFRAHLAQFMQVLGYQPCKADPDPMMKPESRPEVRMIHFILCG